MGDLQTKSGLAKGFMTEYKMAAQLLKDQNKAAFKFLQDPKNTAKSTMNLSKSRNYSENYYDYSLETSEAIVAKGSYADDDSNTTDSIIINKYHHYQKGPETAVNGTWHNKGGYYNYGVDTRDSYNQVGDVLEVSETSNNTALAYDKDRDDGTMKIDFTTGDVLEATGKFSHLSE